MARPVTSVSAIQPTFAHRAEYAALRGAVAAVERLGFGAAGRVGERIGRLGYSPFGIRRDVVLRQISAALPELSEADVERISRDAYGHLGRTSIETAILPSFSAAEIIDLFEFVSGWNVVEERM